MRRTLEGAALAAALVALGAALVPAADQDDELLPTTVAIVKDGKLAKFVARPLAVELPDAGNAPTVEGGSLQLFHTESSAANTYALPAGGWQALGSPPGSKGFKYKGAGSVADPCKVVLIKERVVKAVCSGPAVDLAQPIVGDLGMVLHVGTDSKRYCAGVAGNRKNTSTVFIGKAAPAPSMCSVPFAAPTCCGAEQIVTFSSPGTIAVSTLPAFPFPGGVLTVMDSGPPDAACRHDVIVPGGGFAVPDFCIPALGFITTVAPVGCAGPAFSFGRGELWDGNAPTSGAGCGDADVGKIGDTSAAPCAVLGTGCSTVSGGAGDDLMGDIDTTRGDGLCDGAGVHTRLDVPATVVAWIDFPGCPSGNGIFDAGTDVLVSSFDLILSPTTATATAAFVDKDGDGCARAGLGPDGPVALSGAPAPGPCCAIGQPATFVMAGASFSLAPPLFDLIFQVTAPSMVAACNPYPGPGSCTLDTQGGCLD